jgi:hypothetical protein
MSLGLWVTVTSRWDIGNVRAVLAFLINLFCAIGVWLIAYTTWKLAATDVARGKEETKLLSLLSLNGLGDIIDALPLLHSDLGVSVLVRIILQSAIIGLISVTAILSGPIARYSTRQGFEVSEEAVSGWMATSDHEAMGGALVQWNNTIERLNTAGFPLDQLLDFLPDIRVDWKHDEAQWKSSWAASCQWTDKTPIELNVTLNYTEGRGIFTQIPALRTVFPVKVFGSTYSRKVSYGGAYKGTRWKDILMFFVTQPDPQLVYANLSETGRQLNYLPLDITLSVFHLRNVTLERDQDNSVVIGTGPVEAASYTMAACDLSRVPERTPERLSEAAERHVAWPWHPNLLSLPQAFLDFYRAPALEQSFTAENVRVPSAQELFRFYQAFIASKDTQYHQTATRPINVSIPTVEVAVPFLAVCLVYGSLLIAALFWVCAKRLPAGISIPRTKVEWMMQGIREAGGREVNPGIFDVTWAQLRQKLRTALFAEVASPSGTAHRTIRLELGDDIEQLELQRVQEERRH